MLCMTPNVSYHMADGLRRSGDSCRSGHRMRRRAPTNARRGLQAGWLTPGDVTPTRVTLARPGLLECEKNVMALAIKTAPSAGGNLMSGPPSLLCWRLSPGSLVLGGGSTESESAARRLFPCQEVVASGEQCGAGIGEADIGAALMELQPALGDGEIKTGLVFRRRALELGWCRSGPLIFSM